ncbi:hypothetical protein B0H13DRAFT_1936002, partial [Mycena leptocephala]
MNSSFDFVIIGGGNAGLALAARLVENSKFTICVLEMGKDCSDMEDPKIPGNYMINLGKEFDAGMLSTPQVKSANRVVYNPRFGRIKSGMRIDYHNISVKFGNLGRPERNMIVTQDGTQFPELTCTEDPQQYLLQSQNLPKASEQPSIQTDYVLKPEPALYGDGPIYYYKACAALGVPFNPVG